MNRLKIAERYEVQEALGAGGMGTVYRGMDAFTGKAVAVKQLKTEVISPDMLERFRREGEALRELNHPNIVKMLDAVEEDGHHYLVMEYVDGGDLAGLIAKGRMPLETVLTLAIDLADALTRAHKLSIIHRDLKPANVLIGLDGVLRLTDFGVAHVGSKSRVTEADALIGTLDYLPPEAFSGGGFDSRGDIWAFGVMLFEMLSGERPYRANSIGELIHVIVTQPVPDLETLAPHAPTALVDLVYRMLERSPQERISSVRHVGAALEDILQKRTSNVLAERFDTPLVEISAYPKHNLPAQATPFVGREHELDALATLLADPAHRLITIIAPGGMGKTRLALETAERHISDFTRGAYWVELAPLQESTAIPAAIAGALGMQFQSDGRDELQQLCDYLQNKHLLLVLDNYEHLQEGAGLVARLMQAAPELKIIVTSRRRLDQPGEALFHLSGMEFPAWETPEDALKYAAVQLFMNSAARAKPDFALKAHDLDAVARICKLVEGMPLGIVLAAGWLAMLTPAEVAAELQGSIDVLESDSQQVPARQRSIRAVMDYSWLQMTDDEQAVFMRLSVFRGGFTRDAAQEIAGASLRVLMSLMTKSLIRRDAESGRYGIHELLRQYTEDRLRKAGLLDAARDAHTAYFAGWVAERERRLVNSAQIETRHAFVMDWSNIETAWNHAVKTNAHAQIDHMVLGITYFFWMTSRIVESGPFFWNARERISDTVVRDRLAVYAVYFDVRLEVNQLPYAEVKEVFALSSVLEPSFDRALLLYTRTFYLVNNEHDYDLAEVQVREAVTLFENLQAYWWQAQALQTLGYIRWRKVGFMPEVLDYSEKSLHLFNEAGTPVDILRQVANTAIFMTETGDLDTVSMLVHENNRRLRQIDSKSLHILTGIETEVHILMRMGRYSEALPLLEEAIDGVIEHNHKGLLFQFLCSKAVLMDLLGLSDEVERILTEATDLNIYYEPPVKESILTSLRAEIAYKRSDYHTALHHSEYAYALVKESEDLILRVFRKLLIGLCQVKVGHLEQAKQNLLEAISPGLPLSNQLLGLYGLAELYFKQGRQAEAVELASLLEDTPQLEYFFRSQIPDLLAEWRDAMPEDVYEAAVARGKALEFKKVIQSLTT